MIYDYVNGCVGCYVVDFPIHISMLWFGKDEERCDGVSLLRNDVMGIGIKLLYKCIESVGVMGMGDDSVGFVMVMLWILPYFVLILHCTKDKVGFTSLLIFGLLTWMYLLHQYLSLVGVIK